MAQFYDFYTQYCRIHQQVYGTIPCTRSEWNEWCRQPRREARESDVEFDYRKERDGDAQ